MEGSCKMYVGKTNWNTNGKLWLLFEQLWFFPKHVTVSEKMSLALLVSIPLALLYWHQLSYFHAPTEQICHLICRSNANLFQWEAALVRSEISWKQSAGQRWREAARCMRERLSGTQIESCALGALPAKPEEHLKQPDRWLLFEQLLFVPNHVTLSESKGNIRGFPTEIGRSQNSHFAFLNIARRPLTKQRNLNLFSLNLSLASCMFGRIHIKWVTFMRAGGRYVNPNLFQWVVLACLTEFLCWYIP